MKVKGHLDLDQNQMKTARLEYLASDPVTALVEGRIWYNYSLDKIKVWVNGAALTLATGTDTTALSSLISTLQGELNDTQAATGLGTLAEYTAASANYIGSTTDINTALGIVADQVKQNEDDISQEQTDRGAADGALTIRITNIAGPLGLDFTADAFVPPSASNYLVGVETVKSALGELDAQIKTNFDAIDVNTSGLSTEISNRTNADALKVNKAGDTMTGTLNMGTNVITANYLPTTATHLVNKAYADAIAAGFDPKGSCRAATSAQLEATYNNGTGGIGATLTSTNFVELLSINFDGVDVIVGDRLLVKNQATSGQTAVENGIYDFTQDGNGVDTPWILTRAVDFDGNPAGEVSGGNTTFVEQGTLAGGGGFTLVFDGDLTIGSDDLIWVQTTGSGAYAQLQAEIDGIETATGLDTDGNLIPTFASIVTNYIDADTTIKSAVVTLDTELAGLVTDLSSTAGAGMIGILDTAEDYVATTVEAALAEIWTLLAATTTDKGASFIGVYDVLDNYTQTDLENVLAEIATKIAATAQTYNFSSASALNVHTITHNLGRKYVAITIYDKADDQVIIPDNIEALSDTQCRVSFPAGVTVDIAARIVA